VAIEKHINSETLSKPEISLKVKTALKVLSFGAVFTFEPPLEDSR
jgi:hypothetical protein